MRDWQPDETRSSDVPLPEEPGVASETCPALDEILRLTAVIDAAQAQLVGLVGQVHQTNEVVESTEVPLALWLSSHARMTTSDIRMLTTAGKVLAHMPATMDAFVRRDISWGQLRAIVLAVRHLSSTKQFHADTALADHYADEGWKAAAPDELARRVLDAVIDETPTEDERSRDKVERDRFLSIQPSLLGHGAKLYAEGPNEAIALIADGLDALIPPPDASPRDGACGDVDPSHESMVTQGRRRFDALVWMFATHPALTGNDADVTADLPEGWDGPAELIAASGTPLHLTVTCDLATLLGLADRPGGIVTTLTGGRLRATSALCRRLADAGGTLRLLVVDDHGQVIGVGRKRRVPPEWLREAVTTMFPTSIAPNSRTSAAHTDIDHHREWQDGGETNIDNLAPLDRTFHTAKGRGEWRIRPGPDGTRIVSHSRSGWSQTVIPATRTVRLHEAVRQP